MFDHQDPVLPGRTSEPDIAKLRLSVLFSDLLPAFELESALQAARAASPGSALAEKPKLEDDHLIFFCQMGGQGLQATQLAQGRPVDAEGMGKVAAG